ncbi:MAG: helix-turn-helix transcriptional regulator, partial [Alcanivoracaceae bacterium]|nr:helix-turn-helix transcriptional regulator [Alcanivoracaceae bacterium]
LTKPFDTPELVIRANGLINNRKLIRKTIKAQLSQQITHLDKTSQFIDKLRNEILLQLSDPKLSVESLSSAMAMSRHTLNRKCKSELDKTTVQIITESRMQHALSLLKLNKHSISEIAYGIGYDSLAYFSRTFKKHYGKTPSEIRQA